MHSKRNGLLPGEEADIKREVAKLTAQPQRWLRTPHPMLGALRPIDLIGTEREQHLRNLLRDQAWDANVNLAACRMLVFTNQATGQTHSIP